MCGVCSERCPNLLKSGTSVAGLQDSFVVCFKSTLDLSSPSLEHARRRFKIALQAVFELFEKVLSGLRRQLECLRNYRVNSAVVGSAHDALHRDGMCTYVHIVAWLWSTCPAVRGNDKFLCGVAGGIRYRPGRHASRAVGLNDPSVVAGGDALENGGIDGMREGLDRPVAVCGIEGDCMG